MADYQILVSTYDEVQTTPFAISMNWGDRLVIGSGDSGNDHYARRLSSGTNYWTNIPNGSASGTGNRSFNGQNAFVYYYAHGTVGSSDTSPTALSRIEVYKEQDPNVFALWLLLDVTLSWANTTASIPAGPHADGATVNLTYTNNYGDSVKPNLSFNSTGVIWGSGNDILTPGTNQTYSVTANLGSNNLDSSGAFSVGGGAGIGVKLGALGSQAYVAALTNKEIVYDPVSRGTVSLALTSEDNTNGNFTVTASTTGAVVYTGNGAEGLGYRFRRYDTGAFLGGNGSAFTSNPVLTLGGELRGVGIQVQNRVDGPYNNTGGSAYQPGGAGGPGLISNQISPDLAITVEGFSPSSPPTDPAYTEQIGETLLKPADTEVVLTVAGAQIGDTYRVTKSNGTELVAAFVASATTFDITVPTTLTEFPTNTINIVYINVSRAAAQGGNGNETVAFAVNFERGPEFPDYLIKWADSPSTNQLTKNIGATAHNSDNLGSVTGNLVVQITDCGIGDDYRLKLVSGSNVGNISVVSASFNITTTTVNFFLNQNELPAPGNSALYIVETRAPESTEWVDCVKQPVAPFPVVATDFMYLTVNREDYVGVNNVLPQMIFTGTGVEGPFGISNFYIIANNNTTTNPVPQVPSGRLSNQEYRFNNAFPPGDVSETINASFPAGATGALVGTAIPNSSLGVGALTGRVNVQAWTRVPTILNGTGNWEACQTSGAVSVASAVYKDEPLAAFTINTKSAYIDRDDLTRIVPWIRVGDTASYNPEGNGDTEIAWSTTDPTPDGWTTVVSNDLNGLNNYYFTADFNVAKNTNTTVYVGIRRRSITTSFVGDATYASILIVGSNYYVEPGGEFAFGTLLNNNAGTGETDFQDNNQIVLDNDDFVGTEQVRYESISNPSAFTVQQSKVSATSNLFLDQELQTQYGIDVLTGTTQGGNTSTNSPTVGGPRRLALGATQDTYGLVNPGELPNNDSTVTYEFWRRQLSTDGGDGTKQYPAQAGFYSEFSARRRVPIDGNITVSVPKFHINESDGSQSIVISNASTGADYRIIVTASSSGSPSVNTNCGTVTAGGGTITLDASELPSVGETVSYKVVLRETGTSAPFGIDATGTNVTFSIGRIPSFNLPLKLDTTSPFGNNIVSNTVVVDGVHTGEAVTVVVTDDSGTPQTWATTSVGAGSFTNSNKTITNGQNLRARIQSSTVSGASRTARISLTGPTSGTIYETTYTVTSGDNSSGTGGSGNTGTAYGLEIYSGTGQNNIVIGGDSRLARYYQAGTITVYGTGGSQSNVGTITLTGLPGDIRTDEWAVIVTINSQFAQSYQLPGTGQEFYEVSLPSSNQIRITNNNAQNISEPYEYTKTRYNYWVFRQ